MFEIGCTMRRSGVTRRRAAARYARGGVLLLLVGLAATGAQGEGERFDTVVIDAGHGGEDTGARGASGIWEKDLVLDVARSLAAKLRGLGLSVVMTRSDDTFVPLERRFEVANDARGDLFVSIHANAARDHEVRGTETFFLSLRASDEEAKRVAERENAAFGGGPGDDVVGADPLLAILADMTANEYQRESEVFAKSAQGHLAAGDANSRGVKQAAFVVLQGVQMPSALIEIGFLTHPLDERDLRSTRGRKRIVDALARAVVEYGRRFDSQLGVEEGIVPAAQAGSGS